MSRNFDATALRVLFVTDGRGDEVRLEDQVREAVAGGVRAVQVREPGLSPRVLLRLGECLRRVLGPVDGVSFVNDHHGGAAIETYDGVQLGRHSVPWEQARRVAGDGRLLSCSVHDADELARAAAAGADLALLSPVWPTRSKPGAPALGIATARERTGASPLPLLWLGGVDPERVGALASVPPGQRPVGVAAISAIAGAEDVRAAAARLVRAVAGALAASRD